MTKPSSFRNRIRERERLLGTFVKTNAFQSVEILGTTGLDFIVIDAEHAPFDRSGLDTMMLAARFTSLPALVRIPESSPHFALGALDLGGAGLLAPHVRSASDAERLLASTRYNGNGRGFSNSTRAGNYGQLGMAELVAVADVETVVIAQIEDREAVDCIDSIIGVHELDCLFIGRADLAISYGTFDIHHSVVTDAIEKICQQCTAAGKPLGMFFPDGRDIEYYEKLGVTLFVIGSDQSFLHAHATALRKAFQDLKART